MARRAGKLREELAALDQEIGTAPPSGRQMHKAIPVAIAFLALFSFGGMTWYAYNQGILEGSEEAAPYLKPSGPLKIAPSSPGGVEVPNRDKFVYNRLENREEGSKGRTLIAPTGATETAARHAARATTRPGHRRASEIRCTAWADRRYD